MDAVVMVDESESESDMVAARKMGVEQSDT